MNKNSAARILYDCFEFVGKDKDKEKWINFEGFNFWTFLNGVKLAESWHCNKYHYVILKYNWKCVPCRMLSNCLITIFSMDPTDFKTILNFITSYEPGEFIPAAMCPVKLFSYLFTQYFASSNTYIIRSLYISCKDNDDNDSDEKKLNIYTVDIKDVDVERRCKCLAKTISLRVKPGSSKSQMNRIICL